jgi:phospholipid transport system substrate-binding protein
MKRLLLAALALVAASAVQAQGNPYFYPAPGMYPPAQRPPVQRPPLPDFATTAPDQILRSGIDRLQGFLVRGGAANVEEAQAFLDQEIGPYFDFDYMARWAGGPVYAQMDDAQRTVFATKLKNLFFSALARNLGAYAEPAPDIEIFPTRARGYGREVTVNARVTPKAQGAYPVKLEFRFYPSRAGWKVFDVTANGTSAVAYYRSFFREAARQGSIEACCR